jgi:hypothetical protein
MPWRVAGKIVGPIKLRTAPQSHKGTEKNNTSISCASSAHLFGECADRRNNLFFLRVLKAQHLRPKLQCLCGSTASSRLKSPGRRVGGLFVQLMDKGLAVIAGDVYSRVHRMMFDSANAIFQRIRQRLCGIGIV